MRKMIFCVTIYMNIYDKYFFYTAVLGSESRPGLDHGQSNFDLGKIFNLVAASATISNNKYT